MKTLKIAIIGGGASGLMAAIIAAKNGAKVDIWERNERIGKKILSTGNGKCNFSNKDLSIQHYHSNDKKVLTAVLNQFGFQDTEMFFHELGMMIRSKDTLLYPFSEQASTVLDVLRYEIADLGIQVLCEKLVSDIQILKDGRFKVISSSYTDVYDKVILTCGGKAAPKSGSDGTGYKLASKLGHKTTKLCPGLTGLKVSDKEFKMIAGVRSQVKLSLFINGEFMAEEKGELQLTDYGVSGIAVFQLSRIAGMSLNSQNDVSLYVDLCPELELEALKLLLQKKKVQFENRSLDAYLSGFLNKKLGMYFAKKLGLSLQALMKDIKNEQLYQLANLCKNWKLSIIDINSYEQAQVTAGGLCFSQIDEDLQSKLHKGLYFAGEILDVDGNCGGYNLQWAWSSGYVAGYSASNHSSGHSGDKR